MTAKSFDEYAATPGLNDDQIYMIEKLIDSVRFEFDDNYWAESSKLIDERRKQDYKPTFKREHVTPAVEILGKRDWLSLQQTNGGRPIRDIGALRFFPGLDGLSLSENEITEISAIAGFKDLRRLHLKGNLIRNLSPLADCSKLEQLEIQSNPVEDLSVLATLPSLKRLTISADQLPVLGKVAMLPELVELDVSFIDAKPLDSFHHLPAMPKLGTLCGVDTQSLAGLERFPSLRNLVNFGGDFESLEPLVALPQLTHFNFPGTKLKDLAPLSRVTGLRAIWINTSSKILDLTPLESIPSLRDVSVRCAGKEPAALEALRKKLISWDEDFLSATPRYTPSQKLEILDEKAFAALDREAPYGTWNPEGNSGLLGSELDWLDRKIKAELEKWLEEDDDYYFPYQWQECRWRDLQLMSEASLGALSHVVEDIQRVLSHSKNDWIIYLQSDEGDLNLWVYPEKVVVAEEHAKIAKERLERK
ncbi:leucine-rich repeat domain-containing protein [Luteolibacter soli]|uniref:Leucine-rich repeat domain-containing protein n=1 Tax=Luteolibacter soli TaxID=3135280 RepID=A0ABU9ARD0_9BACT